MPFPMKIQPIDADAEVSIDQAKPVVKSRFKRLFERQLTRISSSEKLAGGDIEPSSVVLDKMVRNFMEGTNNEKSSIRNRCNCFNGNFDGSPDGDLELAVETPVNYPADAGEILKGLVVCASVIERNLAADASSIMEKRNSSSRGKGEPREILTEALRSLATYDAAICNLARKPHRTPLASTSTST
ncbi:uncharacterized protein LOC109822155 [Asparagus officinalis]|uniref:uncharacterized protein LOC109822155 n=1 Tax=Asparagus officinalis TaxID=4686 RepID=UPI00098E32A6|nr:uncharacterized protein LOC109822155 [Asparagus officinalis]